jgi:ATP-binding cassette, subfamily B (MDR/TAP), member 1
MTVVSVLGGIASPLMIISKATSAASSFFEMIDLDIMDRGGLKDPEASSEGDITLQNVHFAYPTRPDIPILKGFNARFRKGKTTASTDEGNHQGNILAGEHDLSDLNLKWWISQIGLVQQNLFLFDDTIFNNVAFGLIGTEWEHETNEVKRKLVEKACDSGIC